MGHHSKSETIYALATPPGRAGIAVMRLSGDGVKEAIERLTGQKPPPPRRAVLRALCLADGEVIDHALVIYFAAPKSFTGEDVVEFHIHGGAAVMNGLMAACGAIDGLRLAEAGEFSRRGFLNGRYDLAEIEGLGDLVAAETSAQRRQALRQMGGEMSALYEDWRTRLLRALAQAEAKLDFPEDLEKESLEKESKHDSSGDFQQQLTKINEEINFHLNDGHRGERLRSGVFVAIIGAPNTGKSTLFNLLARREAAIVSPHQGTTRDILEVRLDLAGWPVNLFDMAGMRATKDEIEAEGVRRACATASDADLRLVMLAADMDEAVNHSALALAQSDDIIIINKIDLSDKEIYPDADIRLSLLEGRRSSGFDELIKLLTQRAARLCGGETQAAPLITRARHREALMQCHQALDRALAGNIAELIAEDLRLAVVALGQITGRVGVEDMLDQLFAEFCIGK